MVPPGTLTIGGIYVSIATNPCSTAQDGRHAIDTTWFRIVASERIAGAV